MDNIGSEHIKLDSDPQHCSIQVRCVTDESSSDEEEEMNEATKEVDTMNSTDNADTEALKSEPTTCHKIVVSDNSSEETSATTERNGRAKSSLSRPSTENLGDDSGVSSPAESPEKAQETSSHEPVVSDSPSREKGSEPRKDRAKNIQGEKDTDNNIIPPYASDNTAANSLSSKKTTISCPNRGSNLFSVCHCKRYKLKIQCYICVLYRRFFFN